MAKFRQFYQKIKSFNYYSYFAVELLLFLILATSLGVNLALRTNSVQAGKLNQSLFFVYLKDHPEFNKKLVETYESVNVKLTQKLPGDLPDGRQLLAASTKENKERFPQNSSITLPTLSGSTLLKPNPATSDGLLKGRDIEVYQVRGGDTIARIAAAFGVSIDTILWENNLANANYIRPGQELKILPVSGVRHIVKDGETITGIAKKYGLTDEEDIETILEYNGIEIEDYILPGEEIIIPNGVKKSPPSPQRRQYLASLQKEDYKKIGIPPDFQGGSHELIWPLLAAKRISQYFWSRHRAIDIPCRDCEVRAAGAGIVELSGWQRGYGYTILLNHGNGLKTRYGHADKLLVSAGQNVEAGQPIMISGSTGRSSGPHLHFEVIKNGSFINPLSLVSR